MVETCEYKSTRVQRVYSPHFAPWALAGIYVERETQAAAPRLQGSQASGKQKT